MKKTSATFGVSIVLALCLVFLLFFYKGPQVSQTASGTSDSASGANPEAIVKKNCITCHGDSLQGGAGPALNKIGSKYKESDIEGIINNGKNGKMPAGLISKDEAKAVAGWLAQKK